MMKKLFGEFRNFNDELTNMSKRISELAQKVTEEILPATLKIAKLKTHILGLYKQMGYDENQCNYHTLVEAGEFEQLEPVVTAMLNKKAMKEEEETSVNNKEV